MQSVGRHVRTMNILSSSLSFPLPLNAPTVDSFLLRSIYDGFRMVIFSFMLTYTFISQHFLARKSPPPALIPIKYLFVYLLLLWTHGFLSHSMGYHHLIEWRLSQIITIIIYFDGQTVLDYHGNRYSLVSQIWYRYDTKTHATKEKNT